MDVEAAGRFRHQVAAVKDHAQPRVAQKHVKVVDRPRAGSLHGEIGEDGFGGPEQLQGLVGEMRAEIEPDAAAGAILFFPARLDDGTVAIVARFHVDDFAELAGIENAAQREEVGIPAAALKYGEDAALFARQGSERAGFGGSHGERLVDHHVLACFERTAREIEMRRIGGGDHDQVDRGGGDGLIEGREDGHAGEILQDLWRVAGNNRVKPQAFDAGDQGRVKDLARESVSDQCNVDCLHGWRVFDISTKWQGSLVTTSGGKGAVPVST